MQDTCVRCFIKKCYSIIIAKAAPYVERLCYDRSMHARFRKLSSKISAWAGSPVVFLGAVLLIIGWAISGVFFDFSDTWQLVINTGTTIITFLMVFLIQNTQNRDGKAVQLKLDELIRATKGTHEYYVGLEDLSDEDIATLQQHIHQLANSPNSTRAIAKLHEKLTAEHSARRHRNREHHKKSS